MERIKSHPAGPLKYILPVALLAVIGALYLTQLHYTLFEGNDNAEVYGESKARNTLEKIFSVTPISGGPGVSSYYMPLLYAVFGTLIFFFDKANVPYYLFTVGLHIGNTLLVYLIAKHLTSRRLPSFMAAFSFGLFYPTFVTTDYISFAVTNTVSGFFYFSTVYLFLKYARGRVKSYYYLSLVTCLMGILSKEYDILLVPVLALCHIAFARRPKLRPLREDLQLVPYALFAIPTLLIDYSRSSASALVLYWGGFNFGIHAVYRFIDFLAFIISVVPVGKGVNACIIYGVLLALPFLARAYGRDRLFIFLLLWLGLSFTPFIFSNFNNIYDLRRYLYFPSAAWFILLYHCASQVRDRANRTFLFMALGSYTILLNIALILAY